MVGRYRKVLIQLKSGKALEGFARRRTVAGHYLVRAPKIVTDETSSMSLEGTVEVHRDQVEFVQVLG